ncbi:hypothetical protein [Streptomyces sp. NPDC005969]|uniref:hypothetical protein n=1 Tax=Streptomyces sp. NPDC005969 TaxID=3156722 RepID=UPI0033CA6BA1
MLDLNSQVKAGNLGMENFRAGLEKAGDVNGKLHGVPVGGNAFARVCPMAPRWTDSPPSRTSHASATGAVTGKHCREGH